MKDTDSMKSKGKLIWQRLKTSNPSLTPSRKKEIIERLKSHDHKKEVDPGDWDLVHPNLLLIADFVLDLCEAMGLPVLFTSIIRPMLAISKTDIHAKKRAFDLSVLGWPEGMPEWVVGVINDAFQIGAISASDGKEREGVFEPAEYKNGKQVKWSHLHFQVRP